LDEGLALTLEGNVKTNDRDFVFTKPKCHRGTHQSEADDPDSLVLIAVQSDLLQFRTVSS
jgi:hypothetical protein